MFGDRRDLRHQEGAARSAIQEPGAATYACHGAPQRHLPEALLLLDNEQGRTVFKPGHGICPRDSIPRPEALQQREPEDASYLRQAVHVSGL